MSELSNIDIEALRARHSLDTFFETGTGDGHGLEHALTASFRRWISVEIMEESARKAREKFGGRGAEIECCPSVTAIAGFCDHRESSRVLWWIDAHFPGVDTGLNDHKANEWMNYGQQMPALGELDTISTFGKTNGDVFLIDDAFFFRAGAAPDVDRSTRVPEWTKQALGSLEPWLANMEKTHDITVDPRDTGIIIVTPRLTGV